MHLPRANEVGSLAISYHLPRYCSQDGIVSITKTCSDFIGIYHFEVEAGLDLRGWTGTPVVGLSRHHGENQEKVEGKHCSFGRRNQWRDDRRSLRKSNACRTAAAARQRLTVQTC